MRPGRSALKRSGLPRRCAAVRISAGIATVDLSSSFESAASPSVMPLRIAQVVYHADAVPDGHRRAVRDQRPGVKTVDRRGSGCKARRPARCTAGTCKRSRCGARSSGRRWRNPVTVSGTADVFEATVSVRILDSAKPRDRQDIHHRELRHRLPRRLLGHDPLLGSADSAWHDRGVREFSQGRAAGQRPADPGDTGSVTGTGSGRWWGRRCPR